MPRREPYFRRSRISQKPRAEQIYLLCRGVNRISGEGKYSEKPNIAEAESGVPRKKGTGTRFVRGGESATVSRQNDSLSPKNTTLH